MSGIRIIEMPLLGDLTDDSSVVGDHAGSGRFTGRAVRDFIAAHSQQSGVANAADYGCVGNGSTDNTAFIQDALDALHSIGGGILTFPPGIYNCDGPIVIPDYTTLQGVGAGSTMLNFTNNYSPCIRMGVVSHLSSIKVGAPPGVQRGIMVLMVGNNGKVHDFILANYFYGIVIAGPSVSVLAVGCTVSDGQMFSPECDPNSAGISVNHFAGCFISDLNMSGPGTGAQPGFSFVIAHGDTLTLTNINATCHGAFDCSPIAGTNCIALVINNCLFDSAFGAAAAARFLPSGGVHDTLIANTWFGISGGDGLLLNPLGSGVISAMDVTGCQFASNGGSGIRIVGSGGGVNGINITGGRAEANAYHGAIVNGTNVWGIAFTGFRAGAYSLRGPNGATGITTGGALDLYSIIGCHLYANIGAALVDLATGTRKAVANNLLT